MYVCVCIHTHTHAHTHTHIHTHTHTHTHTCDTYMYICMYVHMYSNVGYCVHSGKAVQFVIYMSRSLISHVGKKIPFPPLSPLPSISPLFPIYSPPLSPPEHQHVRSNRIHLHLFCWKRLNLNALARETTGAGKHARTKAMCDGTKRVPMNNRYQALL